jgi:hypothetical protein
MIRRWGALGIAEARRGFRRVKDYWQGPSVPRHSHDAAAVLP